ncbi:Mu-like prophage major head subunit gpT family protein [Sorangium sp. So ce1151]|uniref:Mu-like prophage major head subunit gpT family protein n=1 Tax=Sorangium sp. So ce1151 TaxID=3133332 RepID=UPI003F64299E
MGAITQTFIYSFESDLQHRVHRSWARVLKKLWWQRIASTEQSDTLTKLYEWQLSTARIHRLGTEGTNKVYADLVSQQFSITNEYWGESLKLSKQKLRDNKYDLAAQWASDIGDAGAFHPQRQVVRLLQEGKVAKCYDGKPFFATDHPYNPFNSGAGTYANLYTTNADGDPFDLNGPNLAEAYAIVEGICQPDGVTPRYLEGSQVIAAPQKRLVAGTLTGAKTITDPTNSTGGASADNILANQSDFSFVAPIIAPELKAEPHVWYLAVPIVSGDEAPMRGALVYQEREPFVLSTYSDMTDAELARVNQFEWNYEGRSAAQYGDPFMLFRFEGTPPG